MQILLTLNPIAQLRWVIFQIFIVLLKAIIELYSLFMTVAEYQIFDSAVIKGFCYRVEVILGIFMLFRLTISAIQYIIDPDTMKDKQKGVGSVIKKVFIVVILLGSVHYIFQEVRNIQNVLLDEDNNVIKKIIFGPTDFDTDDYEEELSWTIFESFVITTNADDDACKVESLKKQGSFKLGMRAFMKEENCFKEKDGLFGNFTIEFQWLFGIICAGFILWTLLIYTLELGVRCIQLAYLEMISPIPIMLYLNPKGDETLKKWAKQCVATFLDVFIRVAILYFIIWCFELLRNEANIFGEGLSVGIVLLLGLMTFAQRVPKLLQEVFPSLGGSGLSLGFRPSAEMRSSINMLGGASLGAAVGLVGNGVGRAVASYRGNGNVRQAIGNGLRGGLGGAARGLINGSHADTNLRQTWQNTTNANRQNVADTINNSDLTRGYQRNQNILNARSAIRSEAESRVLDANYDGLGGQDAREARERLEVLRNMQINRNDYMITDPNDPNNRIFNQTEYDSAVNTHIQNIVTAESDYQNALNYACNEWINDAGRTNEEVARNVQIINNNLGNDERPIDIAHDNIVDRIEGTPDPQPGDPNHRTGGIRNAARNANAAAVGEITRNEHTIEEMNRQHNGGGH